MSRRSPLSAQPSLFDLKSITAPGSAPEGLRYQDDLLNKDEEEALLHQLEVLPFKPFDFHGYLGRREVISFGWKYDYAKRQIDQVAPIPAFILPLRERAAAFAGEPTSALEQVLINKYEAGAPIGWHKDKAAFEKVIGVSLVSSTTMRFRLHKGDGWERALQVLEPRSAYLLDGAARSQWEHSISPHNELRYSVTFRTLRRPAP